MTTYWRLDTHNDPLAAIRQFLGRLFERAGLDAVLVPARISTPPGIEARIVRERAGLDAADPFFPVMPTNAVSLAVQFGRMHPDEHLGLVMRACEMRALVEVAGRGEVNLSRCLLLGVDCLGTFPSEDMGWRGSTETLTRETLQFARQGGVAVYRYRPACRMCIESMPEAANLTIDLLGLPTSQQVMITARNGGLAERLHLVEITDGMAPPELRQQHQQVHRAVAQRRARARGRIMHMLEGELLPDVDALIAHLEGCAPCRRCLDICPVYTAGAGLSRQTVTRWLASCAGCGLCEEECPRHLPLVAIFRRLQEGVSRALEVGV